MKRGDFLNNTYDKRESEHSLNINSRKTLKINGVIQVVNFDNSSILFNTVCGELEVCGEELSIELLDLDNGLSSVVGKIDSISYISERPKKKRWLRAYE